MTMLIGRQTLSIHWHIEERQKDIMIMLIGRQTLSIHRLIEERQKDNDCVDR